MTRRMLKALDGYPDAGTDCQQAGDLRTVGGMVTRCHRTDAVL